MIIVPYGERVVVERMEDNKGYLPDHIKRDDLVLCKILKTTDKVIGLDEDTEVLIPINALRAVSIAEEKIFIVDTKNPHP